MSRKEEEKQKKAEEWLRNMLKDRVVMYMDREMIFVKEREYAKLAPYAELLRDPIWEGKTSVDELIKYCEEQVERNEEDRDGYKAWIGMLQQFREEGLLQ